MEELEAIMQKFAASDWDLIAVPAQEWLAEKAEQFTCPALQIFSDNFSP